ncbi:MAG: ROK family protein [Bryobacteraceae bacterium]
MHAYSIGVDLGGTNLRAAAIDHEGHLLERIAVPVENQGGREIIINNIAAAVHGVRERVGAGGLRGVGIGVPGFIDIETGIVLKASNFRDLDGFPVRDAIQQILGTPVILENDANAAALGEHWIGAGKDVKNLVLITLGTGIGGGVIIDGKILHGFVGMAGELGHMTVIPDGNPCGCGNYGCLEKHASATAIAAMGRLLHLGDNNLTSAHVYEMAVAGDSRAISVFQSVGRALGIGIANLVNIFNFPLYLLSGGPTPAWDLFAPTMIAEIRKRSFIFGPTNTRVERGTLGADAGLFGAAYLPLQQELMLAEAAR